VQERSGAWLTVKDLQHELQIGEKLAYKLLKSGSIPSVRVGGLIRIYRPQLEEALLEDPELGKEKGSAANAPGSTTTPTKKEVLTDDSTR
jgi:excisionase family DNA binding protein